MLQQPPYPLARMRWFAAVLLCSADAWCEAAPVRYHVRDMGVLPGGYGAVGSDINNLGEITGLAYTAEGNTHAFLYQRRRLQDIGVLPGFAHAFANAINDRTEIVGTQYTEDFSTATGFLYTGGQLLNLETIMGVEGGSAPVDINNRGHIIGDWHRPGASTSEGFVFADGALTTLPRLVPDGPIYPASINDVGDVVGSTPARGGFFDFRAILIRNGQVQNLGVLPGAVSSAAYSVNNSGTVVGTCVNLTPERYQAFAYRDGIMTHLGALPGFDSTLVWHINNHEQIVGTAGRIVGSPPNAVSETRAVLISDGTMQDLNDVIPPGSGWLLRNALGINDRGEIVGEGEYRGNGQQRTFILTPVGQAK